LFSDTEYGSVEVETLAEQLFFLQISSVFL